MKQEKIVSEKDVRYIAALSRIFLKEDEIAGLTKDLEEILHYVANLEPLDTSKVEPTSHVLTLQNVFREDNILASLPQEEVLKIAVQKHKSHFKVPKVIE